MQTTTETTLASFQSIFDEVLFKLRAQGKSSTGDNNECLYRGNDNTKCAVGHLIPDDEYSPDMEGVSVVYSGNFTADDIENEESETRHAQLLVSNVLRKRNCYSKEHCMFLRQLQSIHDSYLRNIKIKEDWIKAFNKEMQDLALEYNLKYTE